MTDMTAPPPRVLDGVRVLDMTQVLAGPACCAMLGALGAEVIKVESSARMDLTRRIGVLDDINASPLFHTNNHNKRSIALNLRGEGGVELAKQLMSHCDVVVEAFRPGILERFGLDYDTLRERMPNLLMISISGNGQDGPEARYGAYAAIFAALGGLAYLTGYPDGMPTEWRGSVDQRVGVTAFQAALAGIHRLRRTGLGGHIDISGRETTTTLIGDAVIAAQASATAPEPMGNEDRIMAPHGCFLTADPESWVALEVGSDAEWEALCEVSGLAAFRDNERFGDGFRRWKQREELNALVGEWMGTQHALGVVERLQARGVAAAPSYRMDQLAEDEHLRSRSAFTRHALSVGAAPDGGSPTYFHMLGAPWSFDGSREAVYEIRKSADFAEDNEYVYRELLGLSDARYRELMEAGVIA